MFYGGILENNWVEVMKIYKWYVFWFFLIMLIASVIIVVLSIISDDDKALIIGSWLSGIFGASTLIYWLTEL